MWRETDKREHRRMSIVEEERVVEGGLKRARCNEKDSRWKERDDRRTVGHLRNIDAE